MLMILIMMMVERGTGITGMMTDMVMMITAMMIIIVITIMVFNSTVLDVSSSHSLN